MSLSVREDRLVAVNRIGGKIRCNRFCRVR